MRKAKKTACFCHGNRDEGQAAGTGVKNHQPQTPVNPQQQRVIAPYLKAHAVRRENIFRLQTSIDLQYETIEDSACTVSYRDAVCGLCVKTVSMALDMPLRRLQASSRSSAGHTRSAAFGSLTRWAASVAGGALNCRSALRQMSSDGSTRG